MKKIALFLLVFLMAVVGLSCGAKPTVVAKDNGAVAQTKSAALLSSLPKGSPSLLRQLRLQHPQSLRRLLSRRS